MAYCEANHTRRIIAALPSDEDGTHCGSYASLNIANIAWETFQKHALP